MTTKYKTAPRTAEATPSLRKRAERLRDDAGRFVRRAATEPASVPAEDMPVVVSASPELVVMVDEWVRLAELQDSGTLSDEEADAISPEWSRLHGEICRFPARSLGDLTAKAPLYRYERDDERASCKGKPTMPLRAWDSVVQDIEALAAVHRVAPTSDPILPMIEEGRRLLRDYLHAHETVPQDPTTIDPPPEWGAAGQLLWTHVDKVLLTTIPRSGVGCRELARFADEYFEANEVPISDDEMAVYRLIAQSPLDVGPAASVPEIRSLADDLDIVSADLRTLQAIHDAAKLISGVADAVSCQPRCYTPNNERWNVVGLFADAISEACGSVLAVSVAEARKRLPCDDREQAARLGILAQDTIENGDKDNTLALADDLKAMV